MRFIPLEDLINTIFTDPDGANDRKRIDRAHKKLDKMAPGERQGHIARNGPNKWSPIKNRLTAILGNKCWYTEAELVGAPLTVDHYRPVCDYWFLAYDADNYRVSCPYANSYHHNELYGCAGGKGDNFPLLPPGQRATSKDNLDTEAPVILDPCKPEDCDLVAFEVDGRPKLNPAYDANVIAGERLDKSLLLLNLDHPDFNTKREQLYHGIAEDVKTYEELNEGSATRATIRVRMAARLGPKAPFSTAARYYLQHHRDLDWVEDLLMTT